MKFIAHLYLHIYLILIYVIQHLFKFIDYILCDI
jgi:hypothetical protein